MENKNTSKVEGPSHVQKVAKLLGAFFGLGDFVVVLGFLVFGAFCLFVCPFEMSTYVIIFHPVSLSQVP